MDTVLYCKKCGAQLVLTKRPHSYEQGSGKKLFIHKFKCPNKRLILDFGHSDGAFGKWYGDVFGAELFYEDGTMSGQTV